MSRTRGDKGYASFSKGLNTESSPLLFPENTAKALDNVNLNRDGSVRRRKGFTQESGGSFVVNDTMPGARFSETAISVHPWESVNGNPELNFLVVQVGEDITIHDLNEDVLSDAGVLLDFDLPSGILSTDSGEAFTKPLQSTVHKGRIFFTGETYSPFYFEYDEGMNTVTVFEITVFIRDFEGVDDELDVDERPATLSDEHHYNLLNQGWTLTEINAYQAQGDMVYPSNAQIWFSAKDLNDDFDPAKLDKIQFGNTKAPNGHFILNAFDLDRDTASGLTLDAEDNPTADTTVSTVASHAGRLWYSGNNEDRYNDTIFFSQVVIGKDFSVVGKCYQRNDPSSENLPDLLDTDGGLIVIPEVKNILKMLPIKDQLYVFATNGIWAVRGGDTGFSATEFNVDRISEVSILGANGIVEVNDNVFFWAADGIYVMGRNEDNNITIQNITESTIQTFYANIEGLLKHDVSGFYNQYNRRIYWLYNDQNEVNNFTFKGTYNKVLIFDLLLGAFYTYSLNWEGTSDDYYLSHAIKRERFNNPEDGAMEFLYIDITIPLEYHHSFGNFTSSEFRDWPEDKTAKGNFQYESFIETGHELAGDMLRNKKALYLYSFFEKSETGFQNVGSGGTSGVDWLEDESQTYTLTNNGSVTNVFGVGPGEGADFPGEDSSYLSLDNAAFSAAEGVSADFALNLRSKPGAGERAIVAGYGDIATDRWQWLLYFDGDNSGQLYFAHTDTGDVFQSQATGINTSLGQLDLSFIRKASPNQDEVITYAGVGTVGFQTLGGTPTTDTTNFELVIGRNLDAEIFSFHFWDNEQPPADVLNAVSVGESTDSVTDETAVFKFDDGGGTMEGGVELVSPSSCFAQARWEWSDSESSGRWSNEQQAYRFRRKYIPDNSLDFDDGFPVVRSRLKLRGKGKALSLKFRSEDRKDFRLLGWAIPFHAPREL